ELAPRARLAPCQGQPGVAASVKAADRVAGRLEHALDLVRAALVDRELDTARRQAARPSGGRSAVVEVDALFEATEGLVRRLAFDIGLVHFLDLVAGMCEAVCELAVVRVRERAGRVGAEP